MTGSEYAVLNTILAICYQYQDEPGKPISWTEFEQATGLARRTIGYAVKVLSNRRIVKVVQERGRTSTYSIRQVNDWAMADTSARSRTSAQDDRRSAVHQTIAEPCTGTSAEPCTGLVQKPNSASTPSSSSKQESSSSKQGAAAGDHSSEEGSGVEDGVRHLMLQIGRDPDAEDIPPPRRERPPQRGGLGRPPGASDLRNKPEIARVIHGWCRVNGITCGEKLSMTLADQVPSNVSNFMLISALDEIEERARVSDKPIRTAMYLREAIPDIDWVSKRQLERELLDDEPSATPESDCCGADLIREPSEDIDVEVIVVCAGCGRTLREILRPRLERDPVIDDETFIAEQEEALTS